jgi:hypothetical protein
MKRLQKTSYCLLLALTVACGAVDAKTLEFGCKIDEKKSITKTVELTEIFTFRFPESSIQSPRLLKHEMITVYFKEDGSTKVSTRSNKPEEYTDIVLDRSYLTFKFIKVILQKHFAVWYRINRETLQLERAYKPNQQEGTILELRDLKGVRSMDEFIWQVDSQCQIGHFEVPEELPPTPFPHHPKPLPNQKF